MISCLYAKLALHILQLLYSFIRGSYGVQHQYQIFWQNTTLPDNDTEIGERGVNGNCVMNVHVNDMVCVAFKYYLNQRPVSHINLLNYDVWSDFVALLRLCLNTVVCKEYST